MKITVYKSQKMGIRVVAGDHIAGEYKNFGHLTYSNAADAYKMETDVSIRNAIALIDPSVKDISTTNMHHVSKAPFLNKVQVAAANRLRAKRPAVISGTNVIVSDFERNGYYIAVSNEMTRLNVTSPDAIAHFCDIAGIPN